MDLYTIVLSYISVLFFGDGVVFCFLKWMFSTDSNRATSQLCCLIVTQLRCCVYPIHPQTKQTSTSGPHIYFYWPNFILYLSYPTFHSVVSFLSLDTVINGLHLRKRSTCIFKAFHLLMGFIRICNLAFVSHYVWLHLCTVYYRIWVAFMGKLHSQWSV